MGNELLGTEFAPAERSSSDALKEQAACVEGNFFSHPVMKQMFDTLLNSVVVVNRHRQIVFANKALINLLAAGGRESIYGMRPGEALDCVHATENVGGCGTTEFCSKCGMVLAVLSSLAGRSDRKECRIMKKEPGDAYDLLVQTTPFDVGGETYVFVALDDISDEKRRRSLERIFFHDIINTAGAVWGLSGLLRETEAENSKKLAGDIYSISGRLIDEIKAQRELLDAENRELRIKPREIHSIPFLNEIIRVAKGLPISQDKEIVVDPASWDVELQSDPVQLGRVLYNMLKNALEASGKDDTITVGARKKDDRIELYVHNPSVMPRDAQLQVFQRSFSTKGANRGIGTYSMKLLSERYLGGTVGFRSLVDEGTTFFGIYPLTLPIPSQS
jgi:nitrogen fixation/metabolism regulation signal transduction histidine kinase